MEASTENQSQVVIPQDEEMHKGHKDSLFKTISNIMFLGLGTSALAIVKVPYNITYTVTAAVLGSLKADSVTNIAG